MYRDKKRGLWRVQSTVRGQRTHRYFTKREDAERYEYELKVGLVKAPTARELVTFKDFAERWMRDYCEVEKAQSQWKRDRYTLDLHLIPALGPIRLCELRKAHLLELRAGLRQKKGRGDQALSPKTVNNVLVLAKRMMAVAVDWDILEANPWREVKGLKIPERDFVYWTRPELETFVAHVESKKPEMARLVTVAFMTGLRAGELAALRAEDVNFDAGKIRIKATVDMTTGLRSETTKSKRIRHVQMNRAVRQALEPVRFLQAGEAVFPKAMFWYLCRRFRRLCAEAKVRPMRFHDLRHSFASNMRMAGQDLAVIQKELGHQSYQMTLRYAHLDPAHGMGATEVLCTPARKLHAEGGGEGKTGGPGVT